ncbi:MAG: type VI secretion system tube protein Hcp [Sediminibacterium sp.]
MKVIKIICVLVCCAASYMQSYAAIDIYMRVVNSSGKQIDGDVTVRGYERTIHLNAGGQANSTTTSFIGGGAGVGKPTMGPFNFEGELSSASEPLMSALYKGEKLNSVDIYYVNSGCNCAFYKVHMENVYLTNLSEATSDSAVVQQFSFAPYQVAWAYYKPAATKPSSQFGWDIQRGTVFSYTFP